MYLQCDTVTIFKVFLSVSKLPCQYFTHQVLPFHRYLLDNNVTDLPERVSYKLKNLKRL